MTEISHSREYLVQISDFRLANRNKNLAVREKLERNIKLFVNGNNNNKNKRKVNKTVAT